MGKSIYDEVQYIRNFKSVTQALGTNASELLGRISNYCEMNEGICKKSQDDLAFEMGVSIKTVENMLKILISEGLVIDNTPKLRVAHSLKLNEDGLRRFDKKHKEALDYFSQLEQYIIENAPDSLRKKYVTEKKGKNGSVTKKILRRYVNFSYAKGVYYVKFTHIIELNKINLRESLFEVKKIIRELNKSFPVQQDDSKLDATPLPKEESSKLASVDSFRKLKRDLKKRDVEESVESEQLMDTPPIATFTLDDLVSGNKEGEKVPAPNKIDLLPESKRNRAFFMKELKSIIDEDETIKTIREQLYKNKTNESDTKMFAKLYNDRCESLRDNLKVTLGLTEQQPKVATILDYQ